MDFHSAYKGAFIRLSKSEAAKGMLMGLPAVRRAKERFIAGDTLGDGVRVVADLNNYMRDGNAYPISGVLDFVGESVTSREEAASAVQTYCGILSAIKANSLDSRIAVKLSQLGLDIGLDFCRENIGIVADHAQRYGICVEIDAEEDAKARRTLDIYKDLHRKGRDVAIYLQSARKGSIDDAKELGEMGAKVRLVKIAYRESPDVAWQCKTDIDDSYRFLMATLSTGTVGNVSKLIVATHDDIMIKEMQRLISYGLADNEKIEFDMLLGIRSDRIRELAGEGHHTGVYVPYGKDWYPYFCRRVGERPENLVFVARSFFS